MPQFITLHYCDEAFLLNLANVCSVETDTSTYKTVRSEITLVGGSVRRCDETLEQVNELIGYVQQRNLLALVGKAIAS